MSFHNLILALIIYYFTQLQALADNPEHPKQHNSTHLADIHNLLQPAIAEQQQHVPFHSNPVSLVKYLIQSRWRNSIPAAAKILIASNQAQDRKLGWELSREYGYEMNWHQQMLTSILKESDTEVKLAAIYSICTTDKKLISRLSELIFLDSSSTTECRQACLNNLHQIPSESERIRLWLIAANDQLLQADCVSQFASVGSSQPAINTTLNWLEKTSVVNVAISNHHGQPTEFRTYACRSLASAHAHQQLIIDGILKHSQMPPHQNDVEFIITAMLTFHHLNPESTIPSNLLTKWFTALPDCQLKFLEQLNEEKLVSPELDTLLVTSQQNPNPAIRCSLCKYLSNRSSPQAKQTLITLLSDKHPGVKLAATVALAKVDPLYDLAQQSEELLQFSVSSPDQFILPFHNLHEAINQLALAGHSAAQAKAWLSKPRSNELQSVCQQALDDLHWSIDDPHSYIPWKSF